jgi:hypothetical protein
LLIVLRKRAVVLRNNFPRSEHHEGMNRSIILDSTGVHWSSGMIRLSSGKSEQLSLETSKQQWIIQFITSRPTMNMSDLNVSVLRKKCIVIDRPREYI